MLLTELPQDALELTREDYDKVFDVNFFGVCTPILPMPPHHRNFAC